MPTVLLIGIPIAVVVLFIGIMSLPDEEMAEEKTEEHSEKPAKNKKKKK